MFAKRTCSSRAAVNFGCSRNNRTGRGSRSPAAATRSPMASACPGMSGDCPNMPTTAWPERTFNSRRTSDLVSRTSRSIYRSYFGAPTTTVRTPHRSRLILAASSSITRYVSAGTPKERFTSPQKSWMQKVFVSRDARSASSIPDPKEDAEANITSGFRSLTIAAAVARSSSGSSSTPIASPPPRNSKGAG